MTEIRFYHMERSPLEQTLPALVTKALSIDHKIMIKTPDEKSRESLNAHLWTFAPNSFLPHGSTKDGNPDHQPVWLTDKDENENAADLLILTGGTTHDDLGQFKLVCEMLNGHDTDAIQAARARWKTYKDEGYDITYWQQGQKGWEKKAG
ncbi:MAG: DNA polymerase III subunit chi [Alphaproteobacteria bacterium]